MVTNSTGVMNIGMDHRKYSRLMDAGAWDSYPGCAGVNLPDTYTALAHDMFRSATFSPFHVMETGSSNIRPAFLAEAFPDRAIYHYYPDEPYTYFLPP